MLILCIVFFLLPFALRGARLAVSDMKNNVADWLPADYEETIDLGEFRKYFVGDQFVVLSGPWCKEGNPTYTNLRRKLLEESLEYEPVLRGQEKGLELIRAHRVGDKYGLLATGDFHEEWGLYRERWLQGRDNKWYYITREGKLYEWEGHNNVVEGGKRFFERMVHGRNRADGKYIDTFGPLPDDAKGVENPFYQNPELVCARPFRSVTTGPEILEKMAGPNGTLRIGNYDEEGAEAFDARIEANKRLTGALFGPTPPPSFKWSFDSLVANIDDEALLSQLKTGSIFRQKFDVFVEYVAKTEFSGDATAIERAPMDQQLRLWFMMWDSLELPPPARQTCLVITISDSFLEELDRIVGRPLMGRSRGRILELATGKCGLESDNVHMGGPPSDNVAIDEEGTSTLLRLASLSGLIGIILSYYSFRSVRITLMLFFVGTVSAISSLAYVWFGGDTLDAILMTMPSLIYVLAISASVHLINYYRDACHEFGPSRAVEIAVAHGWFPCFIAAFTTAIGLASLCTSNLAPIFKFGLYSAIATMATLFFLYSFLPAALVIWPPGYRKLRGNRVDEKGAFFHLADRFWEWMCEKVVRHNIAIVAGSIVLIGIFCCGVMQIQTTVQLLKLFDKDAKVLQDYRWMEANLGKLVPMEILIKVDRDSQAEQFQTVAATQNAESGTGQSPGQPRVVTEVRKPRQQIMAYSLLERMEIGYRIRKQLERFFGPEGQDVVGAGMSTDVFAPLHTIESQVRTGSGMDYRLLFNDQLLAKKESMLEEDYLAVGDGLPNSPGTASHPAPAYSADTDGQEMWRISLRLAALNDVNYGTFVTDLKAVVEPILRAYEMRSLILEQIVDESFVQSQSRNEQILLLGRDPRKIEPGIVTDRDEAARISDVVNQDFLFGDTLQSLLENRGFVRGTKAGCYYWLDPSKYGPDKPFPDAEKWSELLKRFDCVAMVEDDPLFDESVIRQHAVAVVDCRQHTYSDNTRSGPFSFSRTAINRKKDGEPIGVSAIYTGIVPIVYKAQGALLRSLIQSILLSFVMISAVMMILLRNWRERVRPQNLLNFRGGIIAMLPNIFPIVIVFGAMGFIGEKVDIGSMMTASVALGIAVDDTIHFLTWYRNGLESGKSRLGAIKTAYRQCASAMAQTTMIAGFGLSVFALSTFAPTQRFGVLMLLLLGVALFGDLVILPALLAGPLGRFFGSPAVPAGSVEIQMAGDTTAITLPLQRPKSPKPGIRESADRQNRDAT